MADSSYESRRLACLRKYAILDTPPEEEFDDLASVAALVCGTPIALVSLIDESRQWFKAKIGVDIVETPRSVAMCDYAICSPREVMVVPDASVDPRFSSNPFVTGEAHVRFYAGAPLVTPDGYPLGTLCAIDRRPGSMTNPQVQALAVLARQVIARLETKRLEHENAKLMNVVQKIGEGVVVAHQSLQEFLEELGT